MESKGLKCCGDQKLFAIRPKTEFDSNLFDSMSQIGSEIIKQIIDALSICRQSSLYTIANSKLNQISVDFSKYYQQFPQNISSIQSVCNEISIQSEYFPQKSLLFLDSSPKWVEYLNEFVDSRLAFSISLFIALQLIAQPESASFPYCIDLSMSVQSSVDQYMSLKAMLCSKSIGKYPIFDLPITEENALFEAEFLFFSPLVFSSLFTRGLLSECIKYLSAFSTLSAEQTILKAEVLLSIKDFNGFLSSFNRCIAIRPIGFQSFVRKAIQILDENRMYSMIVRIAVSLNGSVPEIFPSAAKASLLVSDFDSAFFLLMTNFSNSYSAKFVENIALSMEIAAEVQKFVRFPFGRHTSEVVRILTSGGFEARAIGVQLLSELGEKHESSKVISSMVQMCDCEQQLEFTDSLAMKAKCEVGKVLAARRREIRAAKLRHGTFEQKDAIYIMKNSPSKEDIDEMANILIVKNRLDELRRIIDESGSRELAKTAREAAKSKGIEPPMWLMM